MDTTNQPAKPLLNVQYVVDCMKQMNASASTREGKPHHPSAQTVRRATQPGIEGALSGSTESKPNCQSRRKNQRDQYQGRGQCQPPEPDSTQKKICSLSGPSPDAGSHNPSPGLSSSPPTKQKSKSRSTLRQYCNQLEEGLPTRTSTSLQTFC